MRAATYAISVMGVLGIIANNSQATIRPNLFQLAAQYDAAAGTDARFVEVTPSRIAATGTAIITGRLEHDETKDPFSDGIWVMEANSGPRLIAKRGELIPGSANQDRFGWFGTPVRINVHGLLAFRSQIGEGLDEARRDAVWLKDQQSFVTIAQTNQQIASWPGTSVSLLDSPSLSNKDDVVFWASLKGENVDEFSDEAIFHFLDGKLTPVIREGSLFPDGSIANSHMNFALGRNGRLAINNALSIFSGNPNDLKVHVREGDLAPGLGDGVFFGELFYARYGIDRAGNLLTNMNLTGPNVDNSNDTSIWSGPIGSMQLVVREGDTAPGTTAEFGDLSFLTFFQGQGGTSAGLARLRGEGVDQSNDQCVWWSGDSVLELVARTGMTAPGLEFDATFNALGSMSDVNSKGQFAFRAILTGTDIGNWNDETIWMYDPILGIRMVLQEGDSAPGAFFGEAVAMFTLSDSRLNDRGDLLFQSFLEDDRKAVFLLHVPEPSAGAIAISLVLASTWILRNRRRARLI